MMNDAPQDECAEMVERYSAVQGGARVVAGVDFRKDLDRGGGNELVMVQGRPARWRRRTGVSLKTITLHFSYARKRRSFSHHALKYALLLCRGEDSI
jgi:hypothetical protein